MELLLFKRLENENEEQFLWRIGQAKDSGAIDLDWSDIADIMNREFREDESEYRNESAYRKPYQQAKRFFEANVFNKYCDDSYLDELRNAKHEIRKEKQKLFDERVAINKILREQGRMESMYDIVKRAVEEYTPTYFEYIPHDHNDGENDLVIHLTDIHYGVNIISTFNIFDSDVLKKPSICIRYSDLSNIILSDEAQKEGIALFTLLKGKEVLGYALKHFSSDRFFRVEGIEMDNENFYLNLSYDDNVAKLGKTFLDTTEVNMHFRDPVGDMGSILDGMLSICTRTNKGFGFTFKGQKSHKIDRVEWSVEKMRKIAEKNISIPYESRKTNQVKTIITRTTSKKIN